MVETWRKGRVFRASAKKPPLRGDRGDVEKGDEEKKKMVAGGRAKTRLYGRRRRRRNSSSRNHGGIVGPSFPPRFSYLFLFSVTRTSARRSRRKERRWVGNMETDVTEGRKGQAT